MAWSRRRCLHLGFAAAAAPLAVTGAPTGLRLLTELPGGNAHPTQTLVVDDGNATPRLRLALRNPEGGLPQWQSFRFGLTGCAGRPVAVQLPLRHKEGGPGVRRAWAGPFWSPRYDDHRGWQPLPREVVDGELRFVVDPGGADTVYVCSMPPNAAPQCRAWIAALRDAHPDWVHDDLASRRAQGLGPYMCGVAPAVRDELGRPLRDQVLWGLRIGLAQPAPRPRCVAMAHAHPSEDHGPLQLRGFVDAWLTDPSLAALRDSTDLVVYPLLAANGVHGGYRRHEPRPDLPSGDDLNRSFGAQRPPGLSNAWRRIWAQDLPPALTVAGLDFHDVSPGGQLAWAYHPPIVSVEVLDSVRRHHRSIQFQRSTLDDTTMAWLRAHTAAGRRALAFTAEVSDEAGTLDDYARVGADWAQVMRAWHAAGWLAP